MRRVTQRLALRVVRWAHALACAARSLRSWTCLVVALALVSLGVWLNQSGAPDVTPTDADLLAHLDWQAAQWQSQPWRLWTAALVHWSGAHLMVNLLACVALLAWGNAAALGRRQTLAWLLAWPVTHLLLATDPSLARYGGLSGLLHAGVAIGAWALIWQEKDRRRLVGGLVLAGLLVKQVTEVAILAHWLGFEPLVLAHAVPGAPQFQVASYAHWCGVVAGVWCAAAVDFVSSIAAGRTTKR